MKRKAGPKSLSTQVEEVVMAQVVEQWHSVLANGFESPIGLSFFQFRMAVNLFSLGARLFLITCNRTVHTLTSSLLLPIIIYHCENYKLLANNVPRKSKNKSKEAGKGPYLKKVFILGA